MKLVNVGCGTHCHPAWDNLDLASGVAGVIEHDLRRGLPYSDGTCDVVYHSHVLEHLQPSEGQSLLRDCFRVLKPGGIVRVVVPDLEAIARAYLTSLERTDGERQQNDADLIWMRIELLDQMVRTESGGEMLRYLETPNIPNRDFVRSRIGNEILPPDSAASQTTTNGRSGRGPTFHAFRRRLSRLRRLLTSAVVATLEGRSGYRAFQEGLYRQSGEVHRWMYDRISLRQALESVGFREVRSCRADESRIPNFAGYKLDGCAGNARKPDSLFVEAIKP